VSFAGIIWATIFCIPFWLIVIFFVKIGLVTLSTIILVVLALVGLILFLFLTDPQITITTFRFPIYELRYVGDHVWHIVSEKEVMERLVDAFDPITPAISRILMGEEIIVSNEIYRLLRT
jgi:predicted PurR-regulated permease PerM